MLEPIILLSILGGLSAMVVYLIAKIDMGKEGPDESQRENF